jgi:hypothetical protein
MAKNKAKVQSDRSALEDELRKIGGDALGDEYVDAYSSLESLRAQLDEAPFRYYWELGYRMRDLTRQEAEQAAKAGVACQHKGSKKLAALLGEDQAKVKLAGYVYDAFNTPQKLEKLLGMQRADGRPLPFFLVALLAVPAHVARINELIAKACAESWSENDARDYLSSLRPADAPTRTGGKEHQLPRNLAIAIERWQRNAATISGYNATVFKPEVIDELVATADAGSLSMDRLDALTAAVKSVAAGVDQQLAMIDRIKAAVVKATTTAAAVVNAPVVEALAGETAADRVRKARRATQSADAVRPKVVVPA